MKTLYSSLCLATFAFGAVGSVNAGQTPNFYECSGKNVNLTLAVGSKAEVGILPAQTVLNLTIGRKNQVFQGEDISTETTLLGDLWEVTLNAIPDLQINYATVVIPSIALGDEPISFKSKLILTQVATPFAPEPFVGVVNPSKYIDIACVASMLYY